MSENAAWPTVLTRKSATPCPEKSTDNRLLPPEVVNTASPAAPVNAAHEMQACTVGDAGQVDLVQTADEIEDLVDCTGLGVAAGGSSRPSR